MQPERFDHILIGTGQATGTLVGGLPNDQSIAVIEGSRVGGTCVNYGCTPTKTLVASAKVAHMARRAAEYGVGTGTVEIDFGRVMERMNQIRNGSNEGLAGWLESAENVTLIRAWAKFEGPKTVRAGERLLTADRIYINVGGTARSLPIDGLDQVRWLDNERILELDRVPEHLIVVGGSYIGLEFAQMFRRFGSQVTVVEAAPQIMFREDADIAATAQQILEDEGIAFHVDAQIATVRPGEGEHGAEVSLKDGTSITGSHLLLAVGRVPNTQNLGLAAAGIETDSKGYIQVDDHTRTNVEGVYALGDVNGHGAFTHTAVNDAEIVLDTIRGGDRKLSDRITTYAMFTDPPLARVGLSEKEAVEQGYQVLKATRAMKRISRAKEMSETEGMVKLLVDAETDLILGATILGVHGDEVINMFTAFMYSGRPCRDYRKAVFVHPTVSELMPWILDDLEPVDGRQA